MPKNRCFGGIKYENSIEKNNDEGIYPGLEKMFMPTELSLFLKNSMGTHNQDRKIITAHKVLANLLNTCAKRGLPKYYAFETMRRLLKLNKYLYSYKHQIIELISVMQDTNDMRLKNHIDYFCKEVNYVKRI